VTTDLFRRYGNLLRADGTNQLQRLPPALDADYIRPDERSFSDLVEYARDVAAELRYYDLSGQPTGDWTPFVESLLDPATTAPNSHVLPADKLEALLATRTDWPPHLVLFLAFLKQFQNLQTDFNQLTQNHLRYYYEKRLGLQPRTATPDDVHVVFELAKNASLTKLDAGTLLDAGKDVNGHPLVYATQNELIVSAATVSGIERLAMEHDGRGFRRFFVADGFSDLEGTSKFTFGRGQLDLDAGQRFMTEAPLGFAVAAPILGLAEGDRAITLLAHLATPSASTVPQDLGYALDVTLTGAKGWLTPDSVQVNLIADGGPFEQNQALSFAMTISAAAPAVVAFDPTLHGPGPAVGRPLVRCLIKGATGIYELLDGLVVASVDLSVDVAGVRNLVVQNTDGPLNAAQPMPLFGSQPRIDAAFYIGSAEILGKRLSSLDLVLEWKSPPSNFYDRYEMYFEKAERDDPNISDYLRNNFNGLFRVDVEILYDFAFRTLVGEQMLFKADATQPQTVQARPENFEAAFAGTQYREQPDLEQPQGFDNDSRFGFVRLVLTKPTVAGMSQYSASVPFEAFGHNAFSRRYAENAIALSKTPVDPPDAKLPNDPYTPVLKRLMANYTATATFQPGDVHSADTFLIVGPFGATRASASAAARVVPKIEGQASLYLGIEHVQPPANVSLLFRIDVGTATSGQVLKPGGAKWSCLVAEDSWQALPSSAVLIDSTEGFQKPGVLAISVPREASLDHDSLRPGLLWLRALIDTAPESASKTVDVKPNAALARFQPAAGFALEDYEQHLATGLPANIITRLVTKNANVPRVQQPNPSFDGRVHESNPAYFRRNSERLRHRNRAVTAWDLERLVLEAFPEVFKVKCLPHTGVDGLYKAGEAALVVVPNLRRTGAINNLEPRPSAVLLEEIEERVAGLASSFATVHAIQPVLERLRVEANVVFKTGRDPGYYAGVLNDDLERFLSPWAYEDGEDILFGARIYRSDILAFVEGRDEYVDHVTGLKLYHSHVGLPRDGIGSMTIGVDFILRAKPLPAIAEMTIGDDFVVGRGVEVAETADPRAILVSHVQHLIRPVAAGSEVCPGVNRLGIGYMTVGLDFIVQPEPAP
jgi:hypothetical protein